MDIGSALAVSFATPFFRFDFSAGADSIFQQTLMRLLVYVSKRFETTIRSLILKKTSTGFLISSPVAALQAQRPPWGARSERFDRVHRGSAGRVFARSLRVPLASAILSDLFCVSTHPPTYTFHVADFSTTR